ncbi:MAG: methyltransferase domain-containing protein [Phycisphaeraceae bacterium]|nr:methyltransferase domain-containing protein [Phycisphaeraceae bacterium]
MPEVNAWREGLADELAFWRDWFARRGGDWPDDYRARLDPRTHLRHEIAALLEPHSPPASTVRILDAGAGPLTVLGRVWPGRTVEVTATDALAEAFNRLIDEFGLSPPLRTIACATEDVASRFASGSFDLAYARNTLDHSRDPLGAIRAMLAVTKPGRCVFLQHLADEAEHERYRGLHQWNFREEGGSLILWRPGVRIDIGDEVRNEAALRVATRGRWIDATLIRRE